LHTSGKEAEGCLPILAFMHANSPGEVESFYGLDEKEVELLSTMLPKGVHVKKPEKKEEQEKKKGKKEIAPDEEEDAKEKKATKPKEEKKAEEKKEAPKKDVGSESTKKEALPPKRQPPARHSKLSEFF
jgi:outer membrane biosynthesis protein TonB